MYRFAFARSIKIFFENNDDLLLFVKKQIITLRYAELLPGLGVDTNRFVPSQIHSAKETFIFLLVARMLWDKGVGEYVEAATKIRRVYPNAIFQLLGPIDDGNPAGISESQIRKWTTDGTLVYFGATESVIEYLAQADCVVLPSYREGCPRSLLEAASMEKPIITTDTPGCRDVVDDEVNGFLCKVRDSDDLAAKMLRMLRLPDEERRKMGMLGREKMICEFDERIVLDRYLDVIRATIEK